MSGGVVGGHGGAVPERAKPRRLPLLPQEARGAAARARPGNAFVGTGGAGAGLAGAAQEAISGSRGARGGAGPGVGSGRAGA